MSEIKWEKVEAKTVRRYSGISSVRLAKNDKGLYNQIIISGETAAKLPWVAGDSVWLYTSGSTLFKLSPGKSDVRLRKYGRGFVIGSQPFAQTVHGKAKADEYRGWVDGDSLIFTPMEEEA